MSASSNQWPIVIIIALGAIVAIPLLFCGGCLAIFGTAVSKNAAAIKEERASNPDAALAALCQEYRAGRRSGDALYKGSPLTVRGIVYGADPDNSDGPSAVLNAHVKGCVLTVWFPSELKPRVAALKPGDAISVSGIVDTASFSGQDIFVQLEECKFVD